MPRKPSAVVVYPMDDGTVVRVPASEVAATILRQRQKLAAAKEHARLGALQLADEQRQASQEHGRKGGRKPKTAVHDAWLQEYETRMAAGRALQLSARDVYEDMAANATEKEGRSVPWTRIRDGVSEARKNRLAGGRR